MPKGIKATTVRIAQRLTYLWNFGFQSVTDDKN